MELFSKFRDTIFLKEDSNLDKQLVDLKNIRKKLKYTNDFNRDIKLIE